MSVYNALECLKANGVKLGTVLNGATSKDEDQFEDEAEEQNSKVKEKHKGAAAKVAGTGRRAKRNSDLKPADVKWARALGSEYETLSSYSAFTCGGAVYATATKHDYYGESTVSHKLQVRSSIQVILFLPSVVLLLHQGCRYSRTAKWYIRGHWTRWLSRSCCRSVCPLLLEI
jgi:hypothetical protein